MKHTKKALLTSLLSMLLCCTMLIGSTFAWFTDSVTSGNNRIVAGNLDIELEYAPANAERDATTGKINDDEWRQVTADTDLFMPAKGSEPEADDATLWEPGHTEYVYLRIRNAGSLALKYRLGVGVYGDEEGAEEKEYDSVLTDAEGKNQKFKLSEYLVFTSKEGTEKVTERGDLWIDGTDEEVKAVMGDPAKLDRIATMEPGDAAEFTLVVYMPTFVGNEANAVSGENPTIYMGINLVATQHASESDSFGNKYDENALLPDGSSLNITTTETTAEKGKGLTLTADGASPADDGQSTTVKLDDGALDDAMTEGGEHTVKLSVTTENIVEANPGAAVDGTGMGVVASIDLTLTVDGVNIHNFSAGKNATVETYIAKGLEEVKVMYGSEEISGSEYKPTTGALTFTTNHFSTYKVVAKTEATSKTDVTIPENEYRIYNEVGLRDLANKVNNGNDFSGITVRLMSDIDLGGRIFTPIGNKTYPFHGIFDGAKEDGVNHEISNLVCEGDHVALFGNVTGDNIGGKFGVIKNLDLDKVTVTGTSYVGGVVAESSSGATVENVHVTNAVIHGRHFVGGIVGHSASVSVKNCSIDRFDIVAECSGNEEKWDDGDKVGGIIGYDEYYGADGCTVSNGKISGFRSVGGVIGYLNHSYLHDGPTYARNNTVKEVEIIIDRTHDYMNGDVPYAFDAGEVIGTKVACNKTPKCTYPDTKNNTVTDVTISYKVSDLAYDTATRVVCVGSPEGLAGLYEFFNSQTKGEGITWTVHILDDIDMTGVKYVPFNGWWMTVDGHGHTISNLTAGHDTLDRSGLIASAGGTTIKNLTLRNVTASGTQAGAFLGHTDQGVKIEGCSLEGTVMISYEDFDDNEYSEGWGGIGVLCGIAQSGNSYNKVTVSANVTLNLNDLTTKVLGHSDNYIIGWYTSDAANHTDGIDAGNCVLTVNP